MHDRLIGLLERADLAVASVSEVLGQETVSPLIDKVQSVRTRLSYPDDALVVALAGGTGSGKSSLLNALCDSELVDVGGVRPTTSHPAAAIPDDLGHAMDGYLDRLGIRERHAYDGERICILDLPDTDSVELEHRYRVDALLPLVDVIVWVTDPEKYRDARLHEDYLVPLAEYSAQFVFVINQIDRLTEIEAGDVRHDMRLALDSDGVDAASVIMTAAAPPAGPPIGLEALVDALEAKNEDRGTLYGKLLTDLAVTCRQLESVAGRSLDFDERAATTVEVSAAALAAGEAATAVEILTRFMEALQAETGGVTAGKLAVIAAEVPDHVRRIAGEVRSPPTSPKRRWFRRAPEPSVDPARIANLLSAAVVRPARAVLARRAVAVASVGELAVEVAKLRSGPNSPGSL